MRLKLSKIAPNKLVLIALITTSVLMSPTLAAKKNDLAKEKYREGMAAIQREDYPAALEAFEASYKIKPKAFFLFNIGMCQKALYRYVASIGTFKRLLASDDPSLQKKTDMKAKAQAAIDEMYGLVGKLMLHDAPDGAEVFVDGKSMGQTPFPEGLLLDPGRHTVRVTLDGYKPMKTEITVASGAELALRAKLTSVGAWIKIACKDPEAVVRLDGKVVGGCPFEGEVDPGMHEVRVKSPGAPGFLQTFEVKSGSTATVAVTLQTGQADGPGANDNLDNAGAENHQGQTLKTTMPFAGEPGRSLLFKTGLIMTISGGAAGALGLIFNIKGIKDEQRAEEAAPFSDEREKYNEKLSVDNAVMAAGYISAGALITTGIVLLVVDSKRTKKQKSQSAAAVMPALGGLQVTF